MALAEQVLLVSTVSVVLLVALTVLEVGLGRVLSGLRELKPRLWSIAPYLGVMVAVLITRSLTQDHAEQLTLFFFDWDLTGYIFNLEGDLITQLQSFQTPELSAYFVFMYLFGYVVLVAFPAIAYFFLPTMTHLKELLAAYVVNDVVGISLYVLFIAYGPRNLGRGFAEPILYDMYPEAAILTGAVNAPINVFPSLHASMAATVIFFAWRTRQTYPIWAIVATLFGTSIIISTMYLGIHWATDVFAGIILAAAAFYIGTMVVENESEIAARARRLVPTR